MNKIELSGVHWTCSETQLISEQLYLIRAGFYITRDVKRNDFVSVAMLLLAIGFSFEINYFLKHNEYIKDKLLIALEIIMFVMFFWNIVEK